MSLSQFNNMKWLRENQLGPKHFPLSLMKQLLRQEVKHKTQMNLECLLMAFSYPGQNVSLCVSSNRQQFHVSTECSPLSLKLFLLKEKSAHKM